MAENREVLTAEIKAVTADFDRKLRQSAAIAIKTGKEINRGLGGIEDAIKDLPKNFKKFNDELKKTESEAKKAAKSTDTLSKSFDSLKSTIASLGIVALNASLVRMTVSFVESANRLQGFELSLKNVTGSAAAAQKEIEFVRREASRVGQSFESALAGFTRFSAVTAKTAIEGEGVRRVFQAVNNITAANGLTQQQYNAVLTQFGQIASKGRVQAEELVQLAENNIPAQRLLADALGVTQKRLTKLLETGKVESTALLLLAEQINKEFSGIAAEAATLVPARIRRVTDQARQAITQFTKEVLNSKEVQELVDTFELFAGADGSGLRLSLLSGTKKQIKEINDALRLAAGTFQLIDVIVKGIEQTLRRWKLAIREFATDIRDKVLSVLESAASKILPDKMLQGLQALIDKLQDTTSAVNDAIGATKVDVNQTIFGAFNAFLNNPNLDNIQKLTAILADAFGIKNYELLAPEKVKKAAKDSADNISSEYQRLLDELTRKFKDIVGAPSKETVKRLERIREDARKALLGALTDFNTRIEKEANAALDLYNKAIREGKPVLPSLDDAGTKKQIKDFQKIFDRAADNIHHSFNTLFSDALSGDLPKIENFADSVRDIFSNLAASLLTEEFIQPMLKNITDEAKKLFGKDGAIGKALGESSTKLLGNIAGGAGLGLAVGSTASRVLGTSPAASTASGALGGAAAGASIGSAFPGYGTVIGAAIGAIAGGALGYFSAPAERTSRADLRTIAPGGRFAVPVQDQARIRSPFGDIGVAGRRIESGDFLTAIAEFDRQISRLLPQALQKQIEEAFRSIENSTVGKNEGAALAQIVQQRGFDAIKAVLGEDVAATVAGPRGQVSSAGIQTVQARVAEALGIVAQIERFKVGPLTDVGEAIRAINDRFKDLATSAEAFGIDTAEIVKEQQRLLGEVRRDVNADIRQRTLEIVDPAKAAFEALAKAQSEDLDRVREAGADRSALLRLHALEREELGKRLAETNEGINQSLEDTTRRLEVLRPQMAAFVRAGLSPTAQQLAALTERFQALRTEALAVGESVNALTISYSQQSNALRQQARQNFNQALFSIVDPFNAALLQIAAQTRQFQQDVAAGILSQGQVDAFATAARGQARFQNALSIASGPSTPAAQFDALVQSFLRAGSPLSETDQQLVDLTQQFHQLRSALDFLGRPTDRLIASYEAQRKAILAVTDAATDAAQSLIDEALEIINGGVRSPIQQVAQAFDDFVRAGNPLSATNQALFDLTETFVNLSDAASLLGLSSADLERSYLDQAAAIREQLIEQIDASLEPRRQVVQQAGDFINRLRVGDELPQSLRFTEAQRQFRNVATSGDLQAAIQSGEQLRRITREAFGSTADFFRARNEILTTIEGLRQAEQAAIEAERSRLIREEGRQLELVNLQRSSLDSLQRIQSSNNDVARLTEATLRELRGANERSDRVESLLRRVADGLGV